jgi:predicted DCC family thiol-disulfide oxidoreductase YuxK
MSGHEIELFFDGGCPLCAREVRLLRRLDHSGRIRFTDIADPAFDPATVGSTLQTLMGRIHARLATGEWIEGVEVFRRLYAAVGFGRLVALSRLPGVRGLLDVAYRAFAANRLRLTGRCSGRSCAVHSRA